MKNKDLTCRQTIKKDRDGGKARITQELREKAHLTRRKKGNMDKDNKSQVTNRQKEQGKGKMEEEYINVVTEEREEKKEIR